MFDPRDVVVTVAAVVPPGATVVMTVTIGKTQVQVDVGQTSVLVKVTVWPVQVTDTGHVVRVVMCVSVLVLVVFVYGVVERIGVVLEDEDEFLEEEVVLEVEIGPEEEVEVGVEEE